MIIATDLPAAFRDPEIFSVTPGAALLRGDAPTRSDASFAAQLAEADNSSTTEAEKTREQKPEKSFSLWENADFGFADLVDIINPLQHLPIVATLYRHMTGDRIGAVPRVVGGALWGRIGGFVSGAVNAVVEWFTGKDIGDHIYAFLQSKLAPTDDSAIAAPRLELERKLIDSPDKTAQPVAEIAPPQRLRANLESSFAVPSASTAAASLRAATPMATKAMLFSLTAAARYPWDGDRDRMAGASRRIHLTA